MELILTASQKLTLSQRMLQSTEILQMSSQELMNYIKELAVENPVVEYEDKTVEEEKFDLLKRRLEWLSSSDEQNRVYYNEEKEDEKTSDIWIYKNGERGTLSEYLLSQINVSKKPEETVRLARYIVYCLDSAGYLRDSLRDIAKITGSSAADVKTAVELVQSLEPAGVGASNLKECLLIQVRRLGINNPLVEKIINDDLEELGKNHIHVIAKKFKVSREEAVRACDIIKNLNPKPGNSFSSETEPAYIMPDVLVVKEDGKYNIVLNNTYFPNITIGSYYKSILADDRNNAAREYVSDKIRQAEWAMKCISRRNNTLIRTVEVMVGLQEEFFEKGPGHLRPMRLSDIAEKIEMHESTVSRAVREKYLQCSWGLFPLSYFFSKAMPSADNGNISPERIKNIIKDIVDGEDKSAPLSDRIITERLVKDGITISRRTVAKYRESIGIPGAAGRKDF